VPDVEACTHEWHCPGALQLAAEGRLTILLPLYCRVCGEAQTKVAPPPSTEQSPIQRAQVLPVAAGALRGR
jgi:hypothetical protein